MSKHELDDSAYEALKAHPVMVEEAMTNQDGAFWAKLSHMISNQSSTGFDFSRFFLNSFDKYAKEQVEDLASDEEISVNEAIHKLLNRCNGGK